MPPHLHALSGSKGGKHSHDSCRKSDPSWDANRRWFQRFRTEESTRLRKRLSGFVQCRPKILIFYIPLEPNLISVLWLGNSAVAWSVEFSLTHRHFESVSGPVDDLTDLVNRRSRNERKTQSLLRSQLTNTILEIAHERHQVLRFVLHSIQLRILQSILYCH